MRIDYCPKCNKAGLRKEVSNDLGQNWRSTVSTKWCPRCYMWVKPVNHVGDK